MDGEGREASFVLCDDSFAELCQLNSCLRTSHDQVLCSWTGLRGFPRSGEQRSLLSEDQRLVILNTVNVGSKLEGEGV